MKMKMFVFVVCLLALAAGVKAQFNHSLGGSLIYGVGKLPKTAEEGEEKPSILGYGIFYYPRYNVSESESSAVSVGLPLTFGLSGEVNSRTGGGISLTADLPLTVDYNFGAGSAEDNESGFGGFIGAGFGYTYTNQTFEYYNGNTLGYDQLKGSSYGPLAHFGLKANISEKIYFLRVFGKLGLETEKFKTFGVAAGVSF